MEQSELLRHVIRALERLGLRYFVTGSVASMFFGEPRFTNDIDIVVDLPQDRVDDFCEAFPVDDFYLSEESVKKAVKERTQFNILHPKTGLKVDIMVPKDTLFNRLRFQRSRRLEPVADLVASFASPEDVILKKMEYFRQSGSEKHLRDIAGMLKILGDRLDHNYLENWAVNLGVEITWKTIRDRVAG